MSDYNPIEEISKSIEKFDPICRFGYLLVMYYNMPVSHVAYMIDEEEHTLNKWVRNITNAIKKDWTSNASGINSATGIVSYYEEVEYTYTKEIENETY